VCHVCCFPCRSWWKAISQRFVGRVPSVGKSLRRCHGFVEIDAVGSLQTRPCSGLLATRLAEGGADTTPFCGGGRVPCATLPSVTQSPRITSPATDLSPSTKWDQGAAHIPKRTAAGRVVRGYFLPPAPKRGFELLVNIASSSCFRRWQFRICRFNGADIWIYISIGNLCFIVCHVQVISWSMLPYVRFIGMQYLKIMFHLCYYCRLSFSSKRFRRHLK
jgi:hypothetical protein